jgi:hypothetical protein
MLSSNGSGLILFRFGTDIIEGDHPVVALQDIFFLDDAFVKVFPELRSPGVGPREVVEMEQIIADFGL